jgi:hypothetical protein
MDRGKGYNLDEHPLIHEDEDEDTTADYSAAGLNWGKPKVILAEVEREHKGTDPLAQAKREGALKTHLGPDRTERPPEFPMTAEHNKPGEPYDPLKIGSGIEPLTETERAVKDSKSAYVPHIILGVIALLSIAALAAMAYAPGTETQFIQNTLGSIALAATAALAGIIKGPGT